MLADSRPEPWHALDAGDVTDRLATGPQGLTVDEAQRRLARHGPNELEEVPPPGNLVILAHQFKSPLIYMLVVATIVTLALEEYIDAAVIGAVLALNAVIGFTQERRAEESVRALMQLLSPHARVVRDGREWDVESRELVPGDVVLLESGTRVPADLRLVSTTNLQVDESLLTGESLPVSKHPAILSATVMLPDRTNMAYTGSIATTGRGRGYVVATGMQTELGAVAGHVREAEQLETPLQRRMAQFARVVAIVIGIAALVLFGIGTALGESSSQMFRSAVALAVAAIPEGLPVVFTIALALGVRRMARRHAIVRRLPAVETLGSTTVIGSDKTGTLTENRMTVQDIWTRDRVRSVSPDGAGEPVSEPLRLALLAGVLATEAEVYRTPEGFEAQGDPTEVALLVSAATLGVEPEEARDAYRPVAAIPFESERGYSASIRAHAGEHLVFVTGAPERLLRMSDHLLGDDGPVPLDPEVVHDAARALATTGLRVLGMAYARVAEPPQPGEPVPDPRNLTFLGLQGMLDPPRAGVAEAIAGCRAAGMRVVMITGDHALTARAIGHRLGLAGEHADVLDGTALEALDDAALEEKVADVSIYARVSPEHKLRVVRALQSRGEVVAVTGDGVNDAPALKQADIGIAMGRSGTDVARDAADMVLADDNFVSIYAAVEEGRVTFDNVRKVTFFLISSGAATIVIITAAVALQWPLPLLPAQLLWLNLVTNGLQDVALAFEPGEPNAVRRPPRPRSEGVISRLLWQRITLTGIVMAIGTLALFRWELDQSDSIARARTVALTTLVIYMALHLGNCRSETRSVFRISPFSNPFLLLATLSALAVQVGAIYLPATQYVLRIEPVDAGAWVRMAIVAFSIIITIELDKQIRRALTARRME